jgi:hypothetical protein
VVQQKASVIAGVSGVLAAGLLYGAVLRGAELPSIVRALLCGFTAALVTSLLLRLLAPKGDPR